MRANGRKKYPVRYIMVPFTMNDQNVVYSIPVIFDHRCQLHRSFSLFALACADKRLTSYEMITATEVSQGYKTQMEHIGGTFKAFSTFLGNIGLDYTAVDDSVLKSFRHWDLKRILAKNKNATECIAVRTVNIKMKYIYQFYLWAQDELLLEDHIGWKKGVKIWSKLSDYIDNPFRYKSAEQKRKIYPLSYREANRNIIGRQHFATSEEIAKLKAYWYETKPPLVAERNVMIVEMIDAYAWRRGALASLKTTDFINNNYPEDYIGEIDVLPSSQKYGQGHITKVKAQFLIRVRQYIRQVRDAMVKNDVNASDALFLGHYNGEPLKPETITRIISLGFRAIGVTNRRTGAHAVRRKSGQDKTIDELSARQESGAAIDPESVSRAVAVQLQQTTTTATEFYNKGMQALREGAPQARLREVVVERDTLISQLQVEKAFMVARIEELESLTEELESRQEIRLLEDIKTKDQRIAQLEAHIAQLESSSNLVALAPLDTRDAKIAQLELKNARLAARLAAMKSQ